MDRGEQVAVLGGVAADQWGLVTTAQAKTAGLNGVQLKRLAEAGLVEAVAHGVYLMTAAGQPQHLETKVAWLRLQPAVPAWQRTAGDPDSGVVSHASACQLHELGDIPAPAVEISVPRRRTTTDPFVHLRTALVQADDITIIDGLPVTTAPKTISDLLRAKADGGHIGGVIADAEQRGLVSIDDLAEQVQPFVRSYGLAPATDGRALIEHLVAQAGAHLHAQELELATRQGFNEALRLLSAQQPQHGRALAEALKPFFDQQAQLHSDLQRPMLAIAEALMPMAQWQLDMRERVRQQIGPLSDALAALSQSVVPQQDLLRLGEAAARVNLEPLKAAQSWNAAMAATMRDALAPYAETRRAFLDAGVGASTMWQAVQAAQAVQIMRPAIEQADDSEPEPDEEADTGTD